MSKERSQWDSPPGPQDTSREHQASCPPPQPPPPPILIPPDCSPDTRPLLSLVSLIERRCQPPGSSSTPVFEAGGGGVFEARDHAIIIKALFHLVCNRWLFCLSFSLFLFCFSQPDEIPCFISHSLHLRLPADVLQSSQCLLWLAGLKPVGYANGDAKRHERKSLTL